MNYFIKLTFFSIFCIYLVGCNEKVTYSGKIFDKELDYNKLKNKQELIDTLGYPNFIDPIENNFFYFSQKKVTKNFFDSKINIRNVIKFELNNNEQVILISEYEIEDEKILMIEKEKTKNNLIERGLIEKIFGGVGKQNIPNTP